MTDLTPISVILPTTGWNDACEEIAAQLRPADELLVVCDSADESVAERIDDRPENVRLVVAGEPEGCSGKANAIAAGMEAADRDRLVWSDDDFHHPPDWLDGLRRDYERYGPTTEVPVFVGQDPLAVLLESTHVLNGTLAVSLAGVPWAGSLVFERDDIDEEAFLEDLRRTVSDDGLLMEYTDVTSVDRTRRVEIGGSTRETLENQVRFAKIVRYHEPIATVGLFVVGTVLAAACVSFPLPALALVTMAVAGVYAAFGIRRWTFLAAYPVALAAVPLFVYGLVRRTFVWGGRRYRWDGKFDVSVETERRR